MTKKRFYETVSVEQERDHFLIKLDSFTLKTPGKAILVCPSERIANLVKAEWDAQGADIAPHLMPCTRLLNVAVEQTPGRREDLARDVYAYIGTDLLCYRAEQPLDLQAEQAKTWDPVLNWLSDTHDIDLKVTMGITAIAQDPLALDRAYHYALKLDDLNLTLLTHFTATFGSAALAIAAMDGYISVGDALNTSWVDERYQARHWGEDEDAKIRTELIRTDTVALGQMLED